MICYNSVEYNNWSENGRQCGTERQENSMKDRLLGRVIADRYRLESRIGVGGMGAVYKARHLLIDRVVAIKILSPEKRGEEHFRAWFLREARAVNRINHANIVDINDFGETEDGLAYLVMEFLEGEPLSASIARGPIDLTRSVDILEQCCAALARAHDLGVVHRDMKPDNIFLLNKNGRADFVKLLDFGLARLARDGRLAAKGAVFGTPEYMSPEQARGEEATGHSDLYSIGVVFYEMLTSRLPFNAKDRDDFIKSHKESQPVPMAEVNPELHKDAVRIVSRLLNKNAPERYRDGHHLLEDLKRLQRQLPAASWGIDKDTPKRSMAPNRFPPMEGVAAWAYKASLFGRMVARAYPGRKAPAEIDAAIDNLWRLSAASTRLEGEIMAQIRKNDLLEQRAREFRAQVGRKIEDLSRESSRLRREISEATVELARLKEEYEAAVVELTEARGIISNYDKERDEAHDDLRKAYERAGASAARKQSRADAINKVESKISKWTGEVEQIESQINEYRVQLIRHSDAVEDDLQSGRNHVTDKAKENTGYEEEMKTAEQLLNEHFRQRNDCTTLVDELAAFAQMMAEPDAGA